MENTEEKIKVVRTGNIGYSKTESRFYTFELAGASQLGTPGLATPGVLPLYSAAYELCPIRIAEYDIIPRGENNLYPLEMADMVREEGLLDEQIKKKVDLLWGQGPQLYETIIEDKQRIKIPVDDTEIQAWLDGWEYEKYLEDIVVDLRTMCGYFDKKHRNVGFRIGDKPFIQRIERIIYEEAALEWYNDTTLKSEAIIAGDYVRPWQFGLTRFPMWNKFEPFKHPVAASYNRLSQYGQSKTYSRASFHGLLNWLRAHSTVARILYMFNLNLAAIKIHIKIPEPLWEKKIDELKTQYSLAGKEFTKEIMEKEKDDYIASIIATVSGADQTSKALVTDNVYNNRSQDNDLVGVEIEAIDLKIKDYIDAEINVAKHAQFELSAGLGLHPALSNLSMDGNLPSGSEQLYAYKLFLLTNVDIAERIACKSINDVIKVNFPGKKAKIGFYHATVITEEQTAPADRTKNKKP